MQAAQGFGRRGAKRAAPAVAPPVAAASPSPAASSARPSSSAPDDEALTAFQATVKADWAQARSERPKVAFWKQYPAMTALGVMAVIFLLITLAPLHMSISALRWIRGGLGVSSLFGFGAKRLFRSKRGG